MSDSIERARLIEAVCARASGWEAAAQCCHALQGSSSGSIQGGRAIKTELERTYKIRLSRAGAASGVVGSERLLSDLASYPGEELTVATMESADGQIYCMFLDSTASQLVACFVARDKRITGQ